MASSLVKERTDGSFWIRRQNMYLNAMLSTRECCSVPSERFVIIFHPILLQDIYTKLINISAVLQYINIITSTKFLILISVPILGH